MGRLAFLLLATFACSGWANFINVYPKLKQHPAREGEDVGEPLFLTPLIEQGKIEEARNKAAVQHKEMNDIGSYSGYLTVNKQYNSNMFFWFFPALHDPKTAPVVLWLQGGPGASSLFGLFMENGPFSVTQNLTLKMRQYSWSHTHNLLYIDNPVGTGYSFTDDDKGYATNETEVGRDLYNALVQFFKMFPDLWTNDFYVTGESYAGKYVPAISHAIKDYNFKAKQKINLKGLAIGNGLTDPEHQLNYADYLYQNGLIDFNGRDQFRLYQNKGINLIKQQKFLDAFEIFNELIDGDLDSAHSLFQNLTGFNFYFNYLHTKDTNASNWMGEWLQRADIRRAIHVGNCTFHGDGSKVEEHLKEDVMQSLAVLIADLVKHYKVLLYNGQLDIIVAYPLTENYLMNLNWTGAKEYKSAKRKIWRVDGEIAGFSKTVGNLTEVMVRNAGHMVPTDQPKWAYDLISRFTRNKPF